MFLLLLLHLSIICTVPPLHSVKHFELLLMEEKMLYDYIKICKNNLVAISKFFSVLDFVHQNN